MVILAQKPVCAKNCQIMKTAPNSNKRKLASGLSICNQIQYLFFDVPGRQIAFLKMKSYGF